MKLRWIFHLLMVILLYLINSRAVAQWAGPIVLTHEQEAYPLGLHLEILEDKEKKWTIEDVTSLENSSQFMPSDEAVPGFGFSDSAYWVRFQVQNKANSSVEWLLLYDSAAFQIDVYLPDAIGGGFDVINTGTALPFETRDVPVRQFLFRLPISSGEIETIYIRFSSNGSLILPLTILSENTFVRQALKQELANGILYGTLIILGIYNFVLFLFMRDQSYLFYVLFFGSVLLGIMALDGFAAQYLWPNQGIFAAMTARFFVITAIIFALLFAMSFLRTRELAPWLHKIILGLALFIFVLLVLQFIWFRETAVIHAILLVLGCIVMITAGVVVWRKGYYPARYYLFAWSVVIVGFAILFLTLADVVPFTDLTDSILRLGLITLALVLSFGLAERINLYRREKMEAQLAISYQRAQIAQDLHDSVTQSLYSADLFAQAGLDIIDAGDVQGARHHFTRIGLVTQQALKEMRLFLYELRPPDVVEDGLVNALQNRLEAVEMRSGMEARLLLDGSNTFPENIGDQFYRIAQEALNNVVKHAQADNVIVFLQAKNGLLGLEVVDDGRGFNLAQVDNGGGMGLRSMQERAEKINGRFSIKTAPEQGTRVKVEVKRIDE